MTTIAPPRRRNARILRTHAKFLKMLPAIRRQARLAFRHLGRQRREELVAETIANAYCAFARLVERDRLHLAFATPLARYAIKQIRAGRRVGAKLNVKDITSSYCQQRKQVEVQLLERYDDQEQQWLEIAVEDRHAGPDHVVMVRIDFGDWLARLPPRNRRIAQALAVGEQANLVAKRFRLSPSRVTQLRQELARSWERFQGEAA